MTISPRHLTKDYAVFGQIAATDLVQLKAMGFRSIINNRPDGEEPNQQLQQALAEAAADLGLGYAYIPVSGAITIGQTQDMQAALENLPAPVLGFCRSGARSTRIWAHAQQGKMDTNTVLAAAKNAGCDVVSLQAELQQATGE